MYPQQPPQESVDDQITVRNTFNIFYLAVSGHATCMTTFLRHSFGSEALGVNGAAALVVILLYLLATGSPAMGEFLMVWFGTLVLQRLRTGLLRRRGWIAHSRYDGYPWLGMRFPFVRKESTAKLIEPFVCMIAGPLLCDYDLALGQFVWLGFFSLIIKQAFDRRVTEVNVQKMHDAELEQRAMVERYYGRLQDY